MNSFIWLLRIVSSVIMLQTLYFKFTAHPQSVLLFQTIGMEPWGRISIGILELIAAALILYPSTTWIGSLLGVGLMMGAIYFHLNKIGVIFDGDAVLFIQAVVVLACCLTILIMKREDVKDMLAKIWFENSLASIKD